MPFFSDINTRDEARGPIWRPFATIRDNVERLVALNLGWSIQLMPGILALAFPQIPFWLRIVMGLYSATVAIPCTGVLYALALDATRGEHLSLESAIDHFRALAVESFRKLTPLYGSFGLLIWIALLAGPTVPLLTTLVTLGALLWSLGATYWGPLFVDRPGASTWEIARQSVQLVWRYPADTLGTAFVTTIALLIGIVSIGGIVLIVPVVIALLQTERYVALASRAGANR